MNDITRVPIPLVDHRSTKFSGHAEQLRAAFRAGEALQVPLNGELFHVVRNRWTATGSRIAPTLQARFRSMKTADGALMVWLEPKVQP